MSYLFNPQNKFMIGIVFQVVPKKKKKEEEEEKEKKEQVRLRESL